TPLAPLPRAAAPWGDVWDACRETAARCSRAPGRGITLAVRGSAPEPRRGIGRARPRVRRGKLRRTAARAHRRRPTRRALPALFAREQPAPRDRQGSRTRRSGLAAPAPDVAFLA